MPLYPQSPFKHNDEVQSALKDDFSRLNDLSNVSLNERLEAKLERLSQWLCTTPKSTTFRANYLLTDSNRVVEAIQNELAKSGSLCEVSTNPQVPELIIVSSTNFMGTELKPCHREIIVDPVCGVAVLRGAHVFSPGIMGIPPGLKVNDVVSVYADLTGNCKKGFIKLYDDPYKVFLGNGILMTTRDELFGPDVNNVCGVGVQMTEIISRVPNLNDSIVPKGHALLQNLPSIICSRILNPLPGETILDMCAAPGNKTTHIAALMRGSGRVLALEKIKSKVERMKVLCRDFGTTNVEVHCFDSTKAICDGDVRLLDDGPPFNEQTFDRILLDVPCSALGQRPQLNNPITVTQLKSYVPLQRKLFSAAARLLKVRGVLLYSTCTITVGENEGMVAWALKKFRHLKLLSVTKQLCELNLANIGTSGLNVVGLTSEQSESVRRFGPEGDTVGFFIACFVKIESEINSDSR